MPHPFIRLRHVRGSLYMLPIGARRWGQCSLCGNKTMLCAQDRDTRWLLGSCCIDDLIFAQKALASVRGYKNGSVTR